MYRLSNTVIGILNLLSLLAAIPIIWSGIRMAKNSTTCESFLQTPLLVIGFIILIISLAGFIGACFHVGWALWVYLVAMLILIAALMIITVFGFVVTSQGGGALVSGRFYKEYHLQDYSPWLRDKVKDLKNWNSIQSCIMGSKSCAEVAAWTPVDYMKNNLTPVRSGCCKPPTSCVYGQQTEMITQDSDCFKWNNDQTVLCYGCDSCKAGVLETIRKDWHKISIVNVVILILLIAIYSIGCCAFQNTRQAGSYYPYGRNRMSKAMPRWDYYWRRW